MAEIGSDFDDMAAFSLRPIITVFVRVLDFLQRMAKGVLAQTFKAVASSVEAWGPEIERVVRCAGLLCARPLQQLS
ncbi:MAG: hypothetical protein DMG41_32775 [Acidobacteria bacterium]|nr:MAG: hypothetical protein AUH13_26195 [Acidobacteria bacterium 13_2_20CM_58_27]PYT76863.1 MAG: hypothetical protein DMG42_03875 [Acidobacteriota bacterium]PYT82718.1 MAG: hypothetical protein DMG41_32775 [Acidobacteriota bacterium]